LLPCPILKEEKGNFVFFFAFEALLAWKKVSNSPATNERDAGSFRAAYGRAEMSPLGQDDAERIWTLRAPGLIVRLRMEEEGYASSSLSMRTSKWCLKSLIVPKVCSMSVIMAAARDIGGRASSIVRSDRGEQSLPPHTPSE
jgi:hypothetical protein